MRYYFACLWLIGSGLQGCGDKPLQSRHDNQGPNTLASDDNTVKEDDTTDHIDPSAAQQPAPGGPITPPSAAAPSTVLDTVFIGSFLDQIAGTTAAGRLTGSAQNRAVAEQIAKVFSDAGLQTGGDGQTYFQAFTANSSSTGTVQTQNIIAVLPGKEKANEVIVIGAHMDHLGTRNGEIYFGADDNASGTAALLGAARALAKVKDQLQRTVVFISFSGEELGLLGSLHYVKNPTFPLNQTKFMLNMDMVGYSNGGVDAIGFAKSLEADRLVKELVSKSGLSPKYYAATQGGSSDHIPFEQMNIPTGVFHTGLHSNYHQPTDTVEKIDRINLGKIAGLAADIAWSLARTSAINLRPLELEPPQYYAYSSPLHSGGCEPGLVTFDEVQSNLASLFRP